MSNQKAHFKPVDSKQDFVQMEKALLEHWYKDGIVEKYLKRNKDSKKKFSFLDGPITANNPMGVHHAWGRTYKDLWQRFYTMQGYAQRFQNGFDEQGLWVEVEVEKELGFKNKKDIEKFGIGKFVNLCKERVKKFSTIQTEQSKRLGYFMDWDNSYHTSSEENNYAIWNFLKVCNEKGYLYKGRDSVPWCPRCGTAISQHEILTEEYKELTHESVFFKLPLAQKQGQSLLVWTTTPWTIPGNVAAAVNGKEEYVAYPISDAEQVWVMKKAVERLLKKKILDPTSAKLEIIKGSKLVGLEYEAPFDDLDRVKKALAGYTHHVVVGDDQLLPVTAEEGTGIVHVAPGAGAEDFKLGKKENLPVIDLIGEDAAYLDQMGELSSQNAKDKPGLVIAPLKEKDLGKFFFKTQSYTHRYPTCWRCKTELVWRVVDEWYIAMDKKDPDDKKGRTLRQEMMDVAKKINWIPSFGLDRELDWLKNMHDWLISKKRYWGLALPIWECAKCGNFEVIGSREELKEKAVEGWDQFDGNSPHRPWVDSVKIKCSQCQSALTRIKDVGNPWLDAGIVPFSTMSQDWFPADFITESFPGQFKNWFYSLIAMSTVLKNEHPFKTVLGFATLLDERGEEMHKSKGNSIEFNEAADKIGVDVMRWMYTLQNPTTNMLFGYHKADELRRRFYLILWNVYAFFTTYANLANWNCDLTPKDIKEKLTALDKWILAALTETVLEANESLKKYDAQKAAKKIEDFIISDLSTWYIRRSRSRVGPQAHRDDENIFLSTLYGVLVTLSKLLAPFTPFVAEEIYTNLTQDESVHLTDYPQGDKNLRDAGLLAEMKEARAIVEQAHATRKAEGIKLRQPLQLLVYSKANLSPQIEEILKDEINVKKVTRGSQFSLNTEINSELRAEGEARELVRQIQQLRKEAGCALDEKIITSLPEWPKEFEDYIKKETLSEKLATGEKLTINKISS